jgi:hypothetical protein
MSTDERFTPQQRTRLDGRLADQDRTLAAMHQLEAALSEPAPRREATWHEGVLAALAVLDAATTDEYENAERPDSLLSDIKRTQPRLRTRVRGVRAQYRQIREAIASLRGELESGSGTADFADVRQRLAWVLTALRHQRARESDLIYDAYFEAFNIDLDQHAPPRASPRDQRDEGQSTELPSHDP